MNGHSRLNALLVVLAAALWCVACGSPAGRQDLDVPRPSAPPGEAADLVLLGGRVVTLDPDRSEARALAARDGRILRVGSVEEVSPLIGDETEVLDLAGAFVMPGFVESHAHFFSLGRSRLLLELRSAKSWQEIVDRVAAAVREAEPGQWIRGRGWHQEKWSTPLAVSVEGFPVHDELSAISPENPVILTHASGHAAFANARALALAGITDATPDPEGGEILRDSRGRPTGLLRETAEDLVFSAIPGDDPRELERALELASQECLAKGITSFHDAGTSFQELDQLKRAADEDRLGVRIWSMLSGSEPGLEPRLAELRTDDYADHRLAVGAIKLYADGALGSRGAWLLEPYADDPTSTGLAVSDFDDLRRIGRLALENGYQLAVHAIGDRANREVLDLYEELFAERPELEDLRWRIEHAQHLHPDDIPRFAELGVVAAMQGVHCTSDGPWVPARIGLDRAKDGAYAWRSLLDDGAIIANGTDAPVEDADPLPSFYASVTRRLPDGTLFFPEQRMTRLEALRSYTWAGAWAAHQETILGSLEEGKLADVTVLSRDLLDAPDDEILQAEVLYTIVGGRVRYRSR